CRSWLYHRACRRAECSTSVVEKLQSATVAHKWPPVRPTRNYRTPRKGVAGSASPLGPDASVYQAIRHGTVLTTLSTFAPVSRVSVRLELSRSALTNVRRGTSVSVSL